VITRDGTDIAARQLPSGRARPPEHRRQRDASQAPTVFCRFLVLPVLSSGAADTAMASAATGSNEFTSSTGTHRDLVYLGKGILHVHA
jgi:hypothetical protein